MCVCVCVNVYVCVNVVVCVMAWLASICVMFAPENGHGPKSQLGKSSFSGWGAQANDNNGQARQAGRQAGGRGERQRAEARGELATSSTLGIAC